jgi:hypothetical protein
MSTPRLSVAMELVSTASPGTAELKIPVASPSLVVRGAVKCK